MRCIRGRRIRCGGDRGTRNGDDGVLRVLVGVLTGRGWVVDLVVALGGEGEISSRGGHMLDGHRSPSFAVLRPRIPNSTIAGLHNPDEQVVSQQRVRSWRFTE